MVACLVPAARGQTPTIEQRWVKTVDGGQPAPFQQDWAVDQKVVGDFIYVFGGVHGSFGEVFVTGRVENSTGNDDMLHMKFDTFPTGTPQTDNKIPRWSIKFPLAGQPNSGPDIPECITWITSANDPNIVPPPPGYTGPGYGMLLPTAIISGSGFDAGTGENWKVLRYVERYP